MKRKITTLIKPRQQIQCIRAAHKQIHKLSLSDRHSNTYRYECMEGKELIKQYFILMILIIIPCKGLLGKPNSTG